jgi:hypothetical protein
LTVGFERPVARASPAREIGPSLRIARSTAAEFNRRRSCGEPTGSRVDIDLRFRAMLESFPINLQAGMPSPVRLTL